MSGEELDKKLKGAGFVLADIARLLGVAPQSINQALNAKDVKSGFLEDLCRVLNVDMSFFYSSTNSELERLRKENQELREELYRRKDHKMPEAESEVYRLWMEHMHITEKMQELFKSQKGK